MEPYQQGWFYRRELPARRGVLADAGPLDLLIVDGYVDLDPDGRPGLGAHAHAELAIPVIGVAKTAFATATHAIPVLRAGHEALVRHRRRPPPATGRRPRPRHGRSPSPPEALRLVDRLTRTRR